jgi:hypothetical protein
MIKLNDFLKVSDVTTCSGFAFAAFLLLHPGIINADRNINPIVIDFIIFDFPNLRYCSILKNLSDSSAKIYVDCDSPISIK